MTSNLISGCRFSVLVMLSASLYAGSFDDRLNAAVDLARKDCPAIIQTLLELSESVNDPEHRSQTLRQAAVQTQVSGEPDAALELAERVPIDIPGLAALARPRL